MLNHTPYGADASAAKAGTTIVTGVLSSLVGLVTDTRFAVAIGVLASFVGIIWACVAGFQKWQEHRIRMRILKLTLQRAERGEPVTLAENSDG